MAPHQLVCHSERSPGRGPGRSRGISLRLRRLCLRGSPLALFSVLPCFLASVLPAFSQDPPADATEMTRRLIYHPAESIESRSQGSPGSLSPVFRSAHFTYRADDLGRIVLVQPDASASAPGKGTPRVAYRRDARISRYRFVPSSDDDRATLKIFKGDAAEPELTAVLWTRERLASAWFPLLSRERRGLSEESFRQDLEVANPVVTSADDDGESIWLSIGHSAGEAEYGIGTLVRFLPESKQVRLFQPPAVAACAVTTVTAAAGTVWFGAQRQDEGVVFPCGGIFRLDPSTASVQSLWPGLIRAPMGLVTALYAAGDVLFAATDSFLCSYGVKEDHWDCSRIVPVVVLSKETPLSNRPGEKPSGKLPPGDYEVRWANMAFLEVVTRDSFDAFLAEDDFKALSARNFDVEPYKLLDSAGGGPAPVRLLDKPGGDPLGAALAYRAPLEKLPTPQGTPAGWVKVRVRAGWIDRGKLEVVPRLIPVEK